MEVLLVSFRKIFIARMSERIGDHHRLHSLNDQTGKTLASGHGDFVDRFPIQTLGGSERQPILVSIEDINRANFRLHAVRYRRDDALERLLQVVRMADEGADILEDVQMRANFPRLFLYLSHGCKQKT